MGLKHFQILLDKETPIYTGGEPVSGKLIMHVDSSEHILGVIIHFNGDTSVEWKKTWYNQNSPLHTTTYLSKETYFDKRYNFLVAGGETVLMPGRHSYPFSAVLPDHLPTSFEAKHGRVRYSVRAVCTAVKVTLGRPRELAVEAKAVFVVINPLDLNLVQGAKDEICLTREKYFSSCTRSGHVALTVTAPYTAYVPGQQIPITVKMEESRGVKLNSFTCSLMGNLAYVAKIPFHNVKIDRETILEFKYGAALRVDTKTWSLAFPIPSLPPSDLLECSLIDISYELDIKGEVAGYDQTIDVKMPITIGTIPFTKIPRLDLLPNERRI